MGQERIGLLSLHMISVHEELVANILTKLPLGSIIRFKLVCKAWRSLIESDFFRHLLHKACDIIIIWMSTIEVK